MWYTMLHKRSQAKKIRVSLSKLDELTPRQIDMIVTAVMSMPDSAIEKVVSQIEKNPAGILKDIRMPLRRY